MLLQNEVAPGTANFGVSQSAGYDTTSDGDPTPLLAGLSRVRVYTYFEVILVLTL